MRMVLHGVADDVGYFVKPAVIQFIEAVQYSALNRL